MIYRVALPKFYIFHHSEDKSKCHKKRNLYPWGTYDANFPSLNPKAFILNQVVALQEEYSYFLACYSVTNKAPQ